jgi:hypothetical protein
MYGPYKSRAYADGDVEGKKYEEHVEGDGEAAYGYGNPPEWAKKTMEEEEKKKAEQQDNDDNDEPEIMEVKEILFWFLIMKEVIKAINFIRNIDEDDVDWFFDKFEKPIRFFVWIPVATYCYLKEDIAKLLNGKWKNPHLDAIGLNNTLDNIDSTVVYDNIIAIQNGESRKVCSIKDVCDYKEKRMDGKYSIKLYLEDKVIKLVKINGITRIYRDETAYDIGYSPPSAFGRFLNRFIPKSLKGGDVY